MLGLRRLVEAVHRPAQRRRGRRPRVRETDPRAPLRRRHQQMRAVEAQAQVERRPIGHPQVVLHVRRPLGARHPVAEGERIVEVVGDRALADPGLLGLVLVGDGEGEVFAQAQLRGLEAGLHGVAIVLPGQAAQNAKALVTAIRLGEERHRGRRCRRGRRRCDGSSPPPARPAPGTTTAATSRPPRPGAATRAGPVRPPPARRRAAPRSPRRRSCRSG